jgi:hypothetical protein
MNDSALYYAAAAAYVVVFLLFASRRPRVALMLILAGAPFQNDLSLGGPARFSIAEINLGLTLIVFGSQILTRQRPVSIGPLGIPVALYIGVCLVSAALSWRGGVVITSIIQVMLYLVGAVAVFSSFGRDENDSMLALQGLVAIGVFLAITTLTIGTNYILGLHKNGLGGSLACAAVVAAELWFAAPDAKRRRLQAIALAVILMGLISSLSRGAWLGSAAGLLVIASLRRQFMFLLKAACLLIPVGLVCWNMLPSESQSNASDFARNSYNIDARFKSIAFASKCFDEDPVLGVGIGLRKEFDATNIVWVTLAETGVVGLAAFALIHVAFARMLWSAQRALKRTDRTYSFLAIGGALMAVKLVHGMVDHYWSRGALLIAWAGAGMATGIYLKTRRRAMPGFAPRRLPAGGISRPSINLAAGTAVPERPA